MKPIPAIVPAPATAAQPTGGRNRPRLRSRKKPRAPDNAHRLASDVAEEDPERDRRGESSLEEAAVDRDARVREREQRHDQVARPRVEEQLQPLVRRDCGPEPNTDRTGELRRRLLPELAEALGGALEIGPRHGIGVRQETHREPNHDRLHARLEQRDPDRRPEREVDEPTAHTDRPGQRTTRKARRRRAAREIVTSSV